MTPNTALGARWAAVVAGLSRGLIETRQSFTETAKIIGHLLPPVILVAALLMLRGKSVPGAHLSVAAMILPGLLGMSIIFGGIAEPTAAMAADREDGTLLRAKATPNGMIGYLVGKIVMFTLSTLLKLLVILVSGIVLVSDVVLDARACVLLALIFVIGMVATVPIGVALGSVMKSSLQALLVPLTCAFLVIVSGMLFPITVLPGWLQSFSKAFPVYWVGLGARSAMLPTHMVAAEVGGLRHEVEMFAVLAAWAAIGLVLAPVLLRRMARLQSGSAVAEVRARLRSKGF